MLLKITIKLFTNLKIENKNIFKAPLILIFKQRFENLPLIISKSDGRKEKCYDGDHHGR